jgi:hypothetical protein
VFRGGVDERREWFNVGCRPVVDPVVVGASAQEDISLGADAGVRSNSSGPSSKNQSLGSSATPSSGEELEEDNVSHSYSPSESPSEAAARRADAGRWKGNGSSGRTWSA